MAIFGHVIDTLPALRALGAQDPADEGVREDVLARLKKAEAYRRFFVEFASAQWLDTLNAAGFFSTPFAPVEDGDLVSFPPWPPSQYLARIAAERPSGVITILGRVSLGLTNASVQADLVEAGLAMPAAEAARLVSKFGRWLDRRVSLRVPFLLGDLCVHLATGGEKTAALRLLRSMLRCGEPSSGAVHNRKAIPRFDRYTYEMVLKKCEAALLPVCGGELFCLLVRQLRTVVHAEHGAEYDDYSWMWAEDLGAEEDFSDGIAEALTAAVVRVARSHLAIQPDQLGKLLEQLAAPPQAIFRRLQLFLLAEFDPTAPLAESRLIDHAVFDDPLVRTEFRLLQAAAWEDLDPAAQGTILAWILAGPARWDDELEGQEPADRAERLKARKEAWQFGWLKPIAGSLSGEAYDLYESLRRSHAADSAPARFGRFGWVGPASPLSSDELRAKSPGEVLDYLRSWLPSADMMDPSPDGLSRELVEVIKARRQEWSALALEFRQGLDSVYLRALFEGLADEHGGEASLDWRAILDLCEEILRPASPSGSSVDGVSEGKRSEICRAIAKLLQRAFRGQLGLQVEHRERVWGVLERLAHDADPEPGEYERVGGRMADPEVLTL
ncbi:MAG: hypothetical protein IT348_19740, partial [Candidatus Eisenbacteria bacterium]|nr:hypothetical protein [Candidatus Eisenbacteria bacterium]